MYARSHSHTLTNTHTHAHKGAHSTAHYCVRFSVRAPAFSTIKLTRCRCRVAGVYTEFRSTPMERFTRCPSRPQTAGQPLPVPLRLQRPHNGRWRCNTRARGVLSARWATVIGWMLNRMWSHWHRMTSSVFFHCPIHLSYSLIKPIQRQSMPHWHRLFLWDTTNVDSAISSLICWSRYGRQFADDIK